MRLHRKGWAFGATALAASLVFSPAFPGAAAGPAKAELSLAAGFPKGRETGYPVPRFVTLKAAKAHMRVGPSIDHPTVWVYSARGLPMEIIEEYGNWRRVRDPEGTTGWMFAPLLSGRRTAVVGPWVKQTIALRAAPSPNARIVARLSAKVRLDLSDCDRKWCKVSLQKSPLSGFIEQNSLWGVYPGEMVN